MRLPTRQSMEEERITLTHYLIEQAATAAGGWRKKQLAVLGVPWPPPKGWKKEIAGSKITVKQAKEFYGHKNLEAAVRKEKSFIPHYRSWVRPKKATTTLRHWFQSLRIDCLDPDRSDYWMLGFADRDRSLCF